MLRYRIYTSPLEFSNVLKKKESLLKMKIIFLIEMYLLVWIKNWYRFKIIAKIEQILLDDTINVES